MPGFDVDSCSVSTVPLRCADIFTFANVLGLSVIFSQLHFVPLRKELFD